MRTHTAVALERVTGEIVAERTVKARARGHGALVLWARARDAPRGFERGGRLLSDHREDLVGERTRIGNRLRWHLHDLEPSLEIPAGALDRYRWLDRLQE